MLPLTAAVTIQRDSRKKGGAQKSGIPGIGGEQIDEKGNICFNKMKYVSEDHYRSMTKGVLRCGDLLIAKDGATTVKSGFFARDIPAVVSVSIFFNQHQGPGACPPLQRGAKQRGLRTTARGLQIGNDGVIPESTGAVIGDRYHRYPRDLLDRVLPASLREKF
jgi:hypothetical protein